jgi:hypothetical protein
MELLSPGAGLLFWTLFTLLLIGLPILALLSLVQSNFKDKMVKLIWVVVIIFLPVAGPTLYFLLGRKQRIKLI